MMPTAATEYNRRTYDRLWGSLADFIRFNPGARHRRRLVLRALDRVRFASLLDVGCGNGELLRLIDSRFPGRALFGVDLSSEAISHNGLRFPSLRFASRNLETDQLPGIHDVVVCCEVLEHLEEFDAAVAKLAAAVAPGGALVVTVPTGHVHETERFFGHVRHPTVAQLVDASRAAGLVVDEVVNWGFPIYALTKWVTNLRPDAALRTFAGSRPYGFALRSVSHALYAANFLNVPSSARGVQLVARFHKPT
jgi:2-polyprenyl-3-methyl-5-hydroxy-6-metoxy-1,4-benzoquinol methylase